MELNSKLSGSFIRRSLVAIGILLSTSAYSRTLYYLTNGEKDIADSTISSLSSADGLKWTPSVEIGQAKPEARQLAMGANGSLYLAAYKEGAIYQYALASEGRWDKVRIAHSLDAQAIAIPSEGILYAGGGNNKIIPYTRTGAAWARGANLRTGSVSSNTISLAIDRRGNVYASDWNEKKIIRLPFDAQKSTFGDAELFATNAGRNYAMVFDPAGNLYTVDSISGNILLYPFRNGALQSRADIIGNGGLANPRGLALDPSGNLYVSGGRNNTGYIYCYVKRGSQFSSTVRIILENEPYGINSLIVVD